MKKSWRELLPVHPAADLFPMLSDDELVGLGKDIAVRGMISRIVVWTDKDENEVLLDGRNRLEAAERAGLLEQNDNGHLCLKTWDGLRQISKQHVGTGNLDNDPYTIVISLNIHRRHLTAEQRRELIAKLLKAKPDQSNRQIAQQVKVDHKTVGTVRAEMRGRGEIPHAETITDTKGRRQPAAKLKPSFAVLSSSESSDWFTPPAIIALVERVLGEIDLDPCWHRDSPVRAAVAYEAAADGLAQEWCGKIFLNPPYGRAIDDWIKKLVAEYNAGNVTEAVALVPARVDTEWFARLDPFPRCFIRGRLTFANAENPAPFPAAAIYIGKTAQKFVDVFSSVGGIWVRLDPVARAQARASGGVS